MSTTCDVSVTTDTQELRPCDRPEDAQDLAAIVADLKRDRMVLAALRTRMSQLRLQRELLGELSEEAQNLVGHLEGAK